MKVTIRVLRLITLAFWIFIALSVSTVIYSAAKTDISSSYEEISTTSTITVNLYINISNNGLYEIRDMRITLTLYEPNGRLLDSLTYNRDKVAPGEEYVVDMTVQADKSNITAGVEELIAMAHIKLKYAGLISTELIVNNTVEVDAVTSSSVNPCAGCKYWREGNAGGFVPASVSRVLEVRRDV